MTRAISMFNATADLEGALTLLACTAFGLPRDCARLSLAECRARFASVDGYRRLLGLAETLGVAAGALPSVDALNQHFDDELLSMRALKLHRGRNVYSAGKLVLWNALWLPFAPHLLPSPDTLALTATLVGLHTTEGHADIGRCADLLTERMKSSEFIVERIERAGHAPMLIARRDAREMAGRVVLYNHYDAADTADRVWQSDPWSMTVRDGRLYGCAIADNKAALAARIAAIEGMNRCPELVWFIQGEEERGSPLAHALMPSLLRDLRATLWLEENGYHELDGTQRVLARTMGAANKSLPPDRALDEILAALARDGEFWGLRSTLAVRGLNKDFFPDGCPFNRNLPPGARYLSFGVNDPASCIHRPDESVPDWTFALHARQLQTAFREVDRLARSGA